MPHNIFLISSIFLALFFVTPTLSRADETIRIQISKSGDNTAKVKVGSRTYLVPITFESGLGWDEVSDAYHLPPNYVSMLERGRISLYISCSGASFNVLRGKRSPALSGT